MKGTFQIGCRDALRMAHVGAKKFCPYAANTPEAQAMTNEELLKVLEEAKASGATALNLSKNQLQTLPPELFQLTKLTTLDLSDNQLSTLPPTICQLTKLTTLRLDGNPIVSPPIEIAEKGIEAIRQYFEELNKGTQPLNEVKLILVGDGAAGKTSLVNQLCGLPFDEHEDVTHGINIHGWEQEVGERKIRINIWDFGGQEIYHATHQLFLSKHSLYVLVIDGRKDERTEYWLRHIESFGGDSPVLIVLNKMDSNPGFDINRPFLLQKYPSIRGFFRISCRTGQGIAQFKRALLNESANLEMTAIRWPQSWFSVKRRLEQMKEPYISADDYEAICKKAGITEEQSRETLLDFLHDLGVVLHFKALALDSFSIIDPRWVTNGIYMIIMSSQVAYNNGILRLQSLREILRQGSSREYSYPRYTHAYLIALMKQFDLFYSISDDTILIAQLLPVAEPDFTFDYNNSLRFALHYHEFLPPSVFPRFIVKTHKDIKGDLRWRTGVVLSDTVSGSEAVVKADMEARRINLWVNGTHRKEYLSFLWFSLREINASFERLHVSERIPMPDNQAVTTDYQTLLKYAEHGIDNYIPEDSDKVYSVRELLGLVEPDRKEQLTEMLRMIRTQLDEKESEAEAASRLFYLKPNIAGIGINLNELFARILGSKKRK